MAKKKETKQEPIEKQLWKAADKLRKNIDAAEYKHIVLGLIFLKYISDSFEELYAKLQAGEGEYAGADPEDRDEYRAENVFFVPPSARWSYLQGRAKLPEIGKDIDNAMDAIERDNASLKGVLPKAFAKENLDPTSLGQLIDLISNIALGDEVSRSQDLLGKVYEYFLGEFALAEGKKGGQFYTPESIVKLLVEMLQPYKGRVFDPCCGSGGMFVQSEKFILAHQGKINDISIYGQESNQTTWRLAKMNLAIRGIDSSQVKWNNEGSFLNNAHKDLKADYIIANPPFNDSDWSGDLLRGDARWHYGIPSAKNANFAWLQHFLYHLSPNGTAGIVLANGALSSDTLNDDVIRKQMIESNVIDCIVMLPEKLFFNTGISASLWFLRKNRTRDEVLFIDASNFGEMVSRKLRILDSNDLKEVAQTYEDWKNNNNYQDVIGFCKSASLDEIKKNKHILTPGRYVGDIVDPEEKLSFSSKILAFNKTQNELDEISNGINNDIRTKLNSYYPDNNFDNIKLESVKVIDYLGELIFKEWIINENLPKSIQLSNNLETVKLSEVVEKSNTGADAIQKAPIVEDDTGVRCIRIGDITNERPFNEWGFSKVTEKIFKQYQLKANDIIVTRTSVLGLSRYISNDLMSVYNNGLIRLQITEAIPAQYVYAWLQSSSFRKYINRITNETSTRPNMKMNYLLDFPIKIGCDNLIKEFSELYSLLIKKKNHLNTMHIKLQKNIDERIELELNDF
ncbi:N-6 DNA methylase [uncultured Kriegella sp.]|jgi:type I restriction enzyme M protein|uniref:N-6 DNA methylase n=1 Tax=uncultured Kriegella sp. TaxID=1798910 RepID=UPI0030DA650B|tara:strand:+ start:87969 stop:90185 length:2217 start_codon:yes stop_codon:yes gene_type:complete